MSYSILSLDGGGTWALIQVRVLQQRYGDDATGHSVLRNYDLVIANSGGSLVLAAMCMNHPLSKIAEMFLNENVLQTIFVKKPFFYYAPWIKHFFPRFRTMAKIEGLRKQLVNKEDDLDSDILLTELPRRIGKDSLQIIITCFDYDRERAVYFRSNKDSAMETGFIEKSLGLPLNDAFKTVSLLHAIHGSSNAPVQFFDDPAEFAFDTEKGSPIKRFWDGAVGGNNNPIAVGILEAVANGAVKEEIRIVSIGTANILTPILYNTNDEPKSERDWLVKYGKNEGFFGDLKKMASSILDDPPDAATFNAHQLLGMLYEKPNKKLIRINPLVKPILDEKTNIWMKPGNANWTDEDLKTLFSMDMAVIEKNKVELINTLCKDFFAGMFDNQGIRIGGKKIEPILGHRKFNEALKDWNEW
ncbi:MAG TPA: patatin-like phospholipase family protein [Bacteroidia bacterium]|jgi:hypothetical protein|nr:patatin-like phospholipase family protein [Bacteroidia bacterium]